MPIEIRTPGSHICVADGATLYYYKWEEGKEPVIEEVTGEVAADRIREVQVLPNTTLSTTIHPTFTVWSLESAYFGNKKVAGITNERGVVTELLQEYVPEEYHHLT